MQILGSFWAGRQCTWDMCDTRDEPKLPVQCKHFNPCTISSAPSVLFLGWWGRVPTPNNAQAYSRISDGISSGGARGTRWGGGD